MENLSERLVDKSIEAFIMGLEIYNKPTIKYRVEGFSFFICNAWELMLKAHLIKVKGEQSIYYSDNSGKRTISLSKAVETIFTNKKDPLRINLETITTLRNTSTHYITEEYEKIYAPLFQACVKNFCDKLLEFHQIDVTSKISQDFLTLRVSFNGFDSNEIIAKYPPELAEKVIFHNSNINSLTESNNNNFLFTINHQIYITKKKDLADFSVSVTRDASAKGVIIKELRDPSNTHSFTYKHLSEYIQKEITQRNIPFKYSLKDGTSKQNFTTNILNLFLNFYDMKNNSDFCYKHIIGKYIHYTYSINAADFILNEIKKDPEHIVQNLKKGIKKDNLRGKGILNR